MPNRRTFLILSAGFLLQAAAGRLAPAWAQASDRAASFVRTAGDKIIGIMQGPGTLEEKRRNLAPVIDSAIDVDGVARFCLGRFWRTATPDQQKRYVELFHRILLDNITSKLGEYQQVHLTIGRSRPQDDADVVTSTVERANNPPTTVEWVVADAASNPKVVDVIAEGTSLRLTQRSDYASYLTHNNNSIDALINAMRDQLAQKG